MYIYIKFTKPKEGVVFSAPFFLFRFENSKEKIEKICGEDEVGHNLVATNEPSINRLVFFSSFIRIRWNSIGTLGEPQPRALHQTIFGRGETFRP